MAKKTKQEKSRPPAGSDVDLAEIERLLAFMEKHRLEQFEYERDGVRVLLKKSPVQSAAPSPASCAEPTRPQLATPRRQWIACCIFFFVIFSVIAAELPRRWSKRRKTCT